MRQTDPQGARRIARGVVAAALLMAAAGCGTMSDNAKAADYCAQVDQLTAQAKDLGSQQLDELAPGELRAQVAAFRVALARVAATSDGRLNEGYSQLQTALDDLRDSAAGAELKARHDLSHQLSDDVDQVQKDWAALQEIIQTDCA